MRGPLGIGFVGCGNIAQIHASSLASLQRAGMPIRPVAAADPSASSREACAANFAFELLTDDARAVLSHDDVDAVYICTPTHTHRDLYLAALDAGKHLYAEKPISSDLGVVRELTAAAADAGVVTQVGFQTRRHALLARVHDLLASGELGPVMAYSLRDDERFPTTSVDRHVSDWRSRADMAGGGTLLEHSIHSVDLAHWLFGPPTSVAAHTRSVQGFSVEDTATLLLRHASGVTGTLVSIYGGVAGREESRLEVFCERGIVEVTWGVVVDEPVNAFRIQRSGEAAEVVPYEAVLAEHLDSLGVEQRPFFWQELAARGFVDAITTASPASPSFDDALVAHVTVDAAYRSAETGTLVTVEW